MSCKKAALWYLKTKGYSVIPTRNKIALVKWAEYSKRLPTTDEIERWWSEWPDADVAICTGKVSGITVIDLDSDDGRRALNEYLPETLEVPTVKTPKGMHYYFDYTPGIPNKARILKDVDVRNDGGYVIAPPSKGYKWLE